MGFPSPGGWQGRSLFSADRPPRVYFFAPWSDYWFGYRENDTKYLFNATSNRFEVYDLAKDPHEAKNLSDGSSAIRDRVSERLASWVQYQSVLMNRILPQGEGPKP